MPAESRAAAAATTRRLFYWVHATHRSPFETGIQRVTRRLGSALSQMGYDVVSVVRNESSRLVEIVGRPTADFEAALAASDPRPLLFIPELTADLVAQGTDPALVGRAYGMRTLALVHDLIPLKLPEHYTAEAVAMFTAYYESFARCDAVLATTRSVADELLQFLARRSLPLPPIAVVPLPAQFGDHPRVTEPVAARRDGEPLKLVTVASWERRKNLVRLLRAIARAQRDADIALTLVGRRGLNPAYDAKVDEALAAAEHVTVAGPLSDHGLGALVSRSHATVYPSWEEGFGLPVGESLWLGRPCLCHNGSSMAETAPGGGTFAIDMTDEDALVRALLTMAHDPELLPRLGIEATKRPLKSWQDYATAVAALFDTQMH